MRYKVAFYLDNNNLNNQDYTKIVEGNPGIGGSEYEFLLVSYLLEQRDNGIDSVLLTRSNLAFPHKCTKYVKSLKESCDFCKSQNIEILVINQAQFNRSIFDEYADDLSLILWAHNDIPSSKLSLLYRLKYVKKIVCCGREMMDLYRDHIATLKSTYIYNIFPIQPKQWYLDKIQNQNNHNVVYMGSLTPVKGFHVLARFWKDILKRIPDAQLYVIGSGRLYAKNIELGRYGLAEREYEDIFMHYLVDSEGNILPSVHFMGLMGVEKFDILGQCKVGIPNPTGLSECLPISSIEMQLMGCSITTIHHAAYLDTVWNQNYLYSKCSQLVAYVVDRLNSTPDNYDEVYDFIAENFDIEHNIQRWEQLIQNIDIPNLEKCSEKAYQMKGLKNRLLKLKVLCPIFNILPLIGKVYNFYRYKIMKYNQ